MLKSSDCFESVAKMYYFGLVYLQGEARMQVLGITYQHISNKKRALQWKQQIEQELQDAGICDDTVLRELEQLYNEMTY